MGREDIDRMIAEALEAPDEPRPPAGRRPLPHGRQILDQYAALCGDGEGEGAEASAEVALPVAPSGRDGAPSSTSSLASIVRKTLGRLKR